MSNGIDPIPTPSVFGFEKTSLTFSPRSIPSMWSRFWIAPPLLLPPASGPFPKLPLFLIEVPLPSLLVISFRPNLITCAMLLLPANVPRSHDFYAGTMLMNFVSIKTQDRSAARAAATPTVSVAADPVAPAAEDPIANSTGGPAAHAAKAVLSSRSTSARNVAERGEEVECPVPQDPADPSNLAVRSLAPALIDFFGASPVTSSVPATRSSSLLSKRSRVDQGGTGLVGISLTPLLCRMSLASTRLNLPSYGRT